MKLNELNQPMDEDLAPPPQPSVAEIRASLARSRADVAAGRTVPGSQVLARIKSMVAQHELKKKNGETDA